MTVTDRTAATDAEFRSRIAPFESAPTPPEVREARVIEEVARALRQELATFMLPVGYGCAAVGRLTTRSAHTLAAAAVAAYRAAQDGGAEEAVRRVEAVAEEFDEAALPPLINDFDRGLVAGYARAAARIRAALAPQAAR